MEKKITKKKKSGFKKAVIYLCTKRRPLSLIVAFLSAVLAVWCMGYAIYCAFNIDNVKSAVESMWGLAYLAKVGLYTFFSILGIVLFGVLGLYRGMLCYFYCKTFKGDAEFFKARRFETIMFSLLSFVMAGAFMFVWRNEKFKLPFLTGAMPLVLACLYLAAGILPLIERIICVPVAAKIDKNNREKVPQKDDITEELERDAEDNALKAREKGNNNIATSNKQAEIEAKDKGEDKPVPESDEVLVKKYGKAAARLAEKFREIDEDDEEE